MTNLPEVQIDSDRVLRRLGERIAALEVENAQLRDVITTLATDKTAGNGTAVVPVDVP